MTDNKTASAKSDATKTENLPETTTKETLPPSPLHTDHGSTLIAEQVVQKIAGIACREVPGVHAMGSTGRRMLSSITCLLYTSPSPRDRQKSRMPSSA